MIDHVIEASTLRYALALLPQSLRVTPNDVGNLSVLDEDGNYIGWIDLAEGTDNGTVHWL